MEGSRSRKRLRPGFEIRQAIKQIKSRDPSNAPQRTPRYTVISFINMLEKADQYFELKSCVVEMDEIKTARCVPEDRREDLIDKLKGDERFNKLGREEIEHALNALNDEFLFAQFHQNALLYAINEEKRNWDGEEVIGLEPNDADETKILQKFPCLSLEGNVIEKILKIDRYVSSDPMYTLALQTRMLDRVLHRKPEVELKKLKQLYPFYYYDIFIAEEQMYKAKTVTFTYDGCDASDEDIKASLSSNGEILTVYHSRLDSQQMAHVTFKDVSTATSVLGLAAQGKLEIGGRPVGVIPTTCNRLPSGVPACKTELVTAAMSAFEKVEDELLAVALQKYSKLVEMSKQRKRASLKKRKTNSDQPDNVLFG